MSKKLKRVAGETPPPLFGGGVNEDAKTMLKHQALLQDYQDLQKDTDDMRNKLDAAKQRKLRLLAEVRFLRRRYKYLLKMKSLHRRQESPLNLEKQHNLNAKGHILQKRETALFKLPPLPKPKPKPKPEGKMYSVKEAAVRNITPVLDLNCRQTLDGGKEATLRSSTPVSELNLIKRIASGRETAVPNSEPAINLNQIQKMQVANDTAFASRTPIFDLNQDTSLISGTSLSGKEATLGRRAPTFDLNEISTEEEEQQNNDEPLKFEEPKIGLIRGGTEEQPNDLKLSVCRNVGEGTSRMGKRKISWRDPVALRV